MEVETSEEAAVAGDDGSGMLVDAPRPTMEDVRDDRQSGRKLYEVNRGNNNTSTGRLSSSTNEVPPQAIPEISGIITDTPLGSVSSNHQEQNSSSFSRDMQQTSRHENHVGNASPEYISSSTGSRCGGQVPDEEMDVDHQASYPDKSSIQPSVDHNFSVSNIPSSQYSATPSSAAEQSNDHLYVNPLSSDSANDSQAKAYVKRQYELNHNAPDPFGPTPYPRTSKTWTPTLLSHSSSSACASLAMHNNNNSDFAGWYPFVARTCRGYCILRGGLYEFQSVFTCYNHTRDILNRLRNGVTTSRIYCIFLRHLAFINMSVAHRFAAGGKCSILLNIKANMSHATALSTLNQRGHVLVSWYILPRIRRSHFSSPNEIFALFKIKRWIRSH